MPTTIDKPSGTFQYSAEVKKYIKQVESGWQTWLFFLYKFPSALWWGFRIKSVSHEKGIVTLPFNWRTQNPYRSIYFAAQSGAAELSTAVIVNLYLAGKPPISVLVLDFKGEFVKKANTQTTFTCEDSQKIVETIDEAYRTGEGKTITLHSTGRNNKGEVVSNFQITWTFKKK